MDIYNEISEIHDSLMLKNMSLLVLLLVTKIYNLTTCQTQISKQADFDKRYFSCLITSKSNNISYLYPLYHHSLLKSQNISLKATTCYCHY